MSYAGPELAGLEAIVALSLGVLAVLLLLGLFGWAVIAWADHLGRRR